MNTRKFASLFVAAALALPAVGTLAGQEFGRDSVYAHPGQPASTTKPSTAVKAQIDRFGRDSVYVTKDTQLSKPTGITVGESVNAKPGRA
jgi:hypothetical protein